MVQKRFPVLLVFGTCFLFASHALAITPLHLHVADSFVPESPFEARVKLEYRFHLTTSRIAREFLCKSSENPSVCPAGNQLVMTRELDTSHTVQQILLDMRAGLYRDLELAIQLPYLLQNVRSLDFANGVGQSNSNLASGLLSVPTSGVQRGGLGDLTLGIRFAPFHHDRNEGEPALVFGVWYTAPTASTMGYANTNVGEGLHQLGLSLDVGYPVSSWMEPWFGIRGTIRVPSDTDLYTTGYATQTVQYPGTQLAMKGGVSMVPWSSGNQKRFLEVTMGGFVHYTFEGREPTILFESLGASPCSRDATCSLNTALATNQSSNGVTDLEGRAEFGGNLSLRLRIADFLELNLSGDVSYTPGYFLTYAIAGIDLNGNGTIESSNAQEQNEYNPVYVPGIDELGQRIRAIQSVNIRVQGGVSGYF